MQQEIQPVVSEPKPGTPVALGEFQDAETRLGSLPCVADPPQKDDEVQSDSGDAGGRGSADSCRCAAGECCSFAARLLILPISFYQKFISPLFPPVCRFTPSCSAYAIEALRKRGFLMGSLLTIWRLLRCHPFCAGGYDPVPDKRSSSRTVANVNEEK